MNFKLICKFNFHFFFGLQFRCELQEENCENANDTIRSCYWGGGGSAASANTHLHTDKPTHRQNGHTRN